MPSGVYQRKEKRPPRPKEDRKNGCLCCGNKYIDGRFQFRYCSMKCFMKHDMKAFSKKKLWIPLKLKPKIQFNKYGLLYEPRTENEVLFLFAKLHKRLGFKDMSIIKKEYPDCIAVDYKGRSIRIEFEYYSKSFHHDVNGCDLIVCWEHDWKECPLKVISLKEFISSKNSKIESKTTKIKPILNVGIL